MTFSLTTATFSLGASVVATVVVSVGAEVASVVAVSTRLGPEEGSVEGPASFLKQPVNMVAHRKAAAVALTKRMTFRELV